MWTEVEPIGPVESGDVGGDEQLSEAWGRRFVAPPDDEKNIPVMTISFYVADENCHGDEPKLFLRRHVEYMLCTNLADLGGTEQWSDCGYLTEPTTGTLDEATARDACARMPVPTAQTWDGVRWHNTQDAPWWRAGQR